MTGKTAITRAYTITGWMFDDTSVVRERCERSLHSFMRNAWKFVEGGGFQSNWHIEAICEHLEAVTKGQIRNLIINIPPRHTKSMTVSVMWPAWEWGPAGKPGTQWLFTSYSADLSLRDAQKSRTVITSQWYQRMWGSQFKLMGDQNAKERFNTNKGGYRVSTSIGGMATGEGGNRIVVDDPHNLSPTENTDANRKKVHQWWDQTMRTRVNDPNQGSRIIIMQRSHMDDLVGHLDKRDYERLIIQEEYAPKAQYTTKLGFVDPRIKDGELLWPERFTPEEIKSIKEDLGSYAYSAQFQQDPVPIEGAIFKPTWVRHYSEDPIEIAKKCDFIFQSWDMTFKDTKTSDYVVGLVVGIKGAERYLLDRVRDQMDFTTTLRAVRTLTLKWPKATLKLVEDKANGPAVINTLQSEISGLVAFKPEGSKESRAVSVSPEFEAGNVKLPSVDNAPWVMEFIMFLTSFPKAKDDDVDAIVQALIKAKEIGRRLATNLPKPQSLQQRSNWIGRV